MAEIKDLTVRGQQAVSTGLSVRRGFEDEQDGDLILPRAKVIQPTSQELVDERYSEMNLKMGNIINSLTKELLPTKFIPIFKFNSRVLWVPKDQGGGMACRSLDGKTGKVTDFEKRGPFDKESKTYKYDPAFKNGDICDCDTCRFAQWEGDVPPVCMPSMNFFAMFEGMVFPLVLPFKSTSMKFGKKLYSMAKMRPGDMFKYVYELKSVRRQNEKGVFFETDIFPAGVASEEDYKNAESMYMAFKGQEIKFDEDVEESAETRAETFKNSVTDDM